MRRGSGSTGFRRPPSGRSGGNTARLSAPGLGFPPRAPWLLHAAALELLSAGNRAAAAYLAYAARDVLLEDGTEVTLDQLAEECGLEPLAYLEPMPPLIEICTDWEENR